MDKTKNVFISHFHGDDEHVHKLKDLLADKGYQLKNSSIDSTKPNQANNPDYIRRLLRLRIQWSGTTIVLIGQHTHTREWVDWEIEQAHKKGKRIVGVYINGASDSDVPENFKLYGDALVGWTRDKIIGAIEEKINNWENPDGTEWISPWTRVTSEC